MCVQRTLFPCETVFFFELNIRTAKPKISEVVQETKVLLQQSRERLVIT